MTFPIDVDACLRTPLPAPAATPPAYAGSAHSTDTRAVAQAALAAAWPKTNRHLAQLALMGGLVRGGWSDEEILAFVDDRFDSSIPGAAHRAQILATTRAAEKPTGFGPHGLQLYIAPKVVSAARGLLGITDDTPDYVLPERFGGPPITPLTAPDFFSWDDIDDPLPALKYTIADWFVTGSVGMIVAPGSSLKTWIAYSMALSVARGEPWLGKYPVQIGRAAILDFESGRYEVRRRLQILGGSGPRKALGVVSYPSVRLTDPKFWQDLAGMNLTFLVIDSLHAAAPELDENDSRIGILLQLASQFAEATGCTVVYLHHENKGKTDDVRNKVRGSTALFGGCDCVYRLAKLDSPADTPRGRILVSKPGAGLPPKPITVELSNATGLRLVEETTGGVDSEANLRGEILLSLRTMGPAAGVKDLRSRIGKNEHAVRDAVGVLIEQGEILKDGNALHYDTKEAQYARVREAVVQHQALGEQITTAARLAKLAKVNANTVARLEREKQIELSFGSYVVR